MKKQQLALLAFLCMHSVTAFAQTPISGPVTINGGGQVFNKQFGTGPYYDWLSLSGHEQAEKPVTGVHSTIIGYNVGNLLNGNGLPVTRNTQPTGAYSQSWAVTMGSGETYNNFTIWGGRSSVPGTALSPLLNIAANGDIGIGTTSPSAKLDVAGHLKVGGFIMNESSQDYTSVRLKPATGNTSSLSGIFEVYEKADLSNSASTLFGMSNSSWAAPLSCVALISSKQGSGVTKDIMMWATDVPNASNSAFCIKANTGNIGIGTADPQSYKLAVEGTIGARKVKVTTAPWADYVFAPGYQLPSLQQVEAHIRQHQHLPGVTSAADIEKNGLDLADMQKQQMEKIEELTLYIIQLNKKLEQQEKEIAELKKKTGPQ